ncbi:Imm59 family immunity protein [Enterococcus sp. LJL51]|uniref:Imm59 family immunity protein n=1 Tax=Enterococcus sp. LJL51 TaxID=3416656 RepID=UPI003CE960EE
MDRKKAKKIISEENLTNYNLFEEHPVKENEIVICKKNQNWCVFFTSERATPEGIEEFATEEKALDSFIQRIRSNKIVLDYFTKKRSKE